MCTFNSTETKKKKNIDLLMLIEEDLVGESVYIVNWYSITVMIVMNQPNSSPNQPA